MGGTSRSGVLPRLVMVSLLLVAFAVVMPSRVDASCFPALFNFGDSQSDTGGIQATFPSYTPAEYFPYGETFFESPQNRYCDGRLLIDFLAEGLGLPFLDPYLQSVTSDFKHGANFATAGATVRPVTYLSPFFLPIQVGQFLSFRKGVLDMWNKKKWTWARSSTDVKSAGGFRAERLNRLPPPEAFEKALYTINIGGNDYTFGYTKGKTTDEVKEYLPEVVDGIANAIHRIHNEANGRYFMVWDMEPQGCLPYMKTLIWHEDKDRNEMDCLPKYNEAAIFMNDLLNSTLARLREQYTDSTIIFLSTYQMKMDIFRDPHKAGFKTIDKACCGIPNRWHYDLRVACGQTNTIDNVTLAYEACSDPSEYVVWDGVHTTEAANRYQAKKILSGKYLYPPFTKLTEGCDLSTLT
ncbi:unnamed protein product [Calypogeia fissa]